MRVLFCALALGCVACGPPDVVTKTHESVEVRVAKTGVDNFNEGGAVAGYLLFGNKHGGSLIGGAATGLALAEGCYVVMETGEHRSGSNLCKLKPGDVVRATRVVTTYTNPTTKKSRIFVSHNFYWPK